MVEPGSIGKGTSGWGVTVVFSDLNTVITDLGGWIAVGTVLWQAVRKIKARHPDRQLVLRDPATAGALAIAAFDSHQIANCHPIKTVCMSSGSDGIGYDARDIWVTSLERPDSSLLFIMSSPSGSILDSVVVIPEPFR